MFWLLWMQFARRGPSEGLDIGLPLTHFAVSFFFQVGRGLCSNADLLHNFQSLHDMGWDGRAKLPKSGFSFVGNYLVISWLDPVAHNWQRMMCPQKRVRSSSYPIYIYTHTEYLNIWWGHWTSCLGLLILELEAIGIFLLLVEFVVLHICSARRNGWKEKNKDLTAAPIMKMNVLHKPWKNPSQTLHWHIFMKHKHYGNMNRECFKENLSLLLVLYIRNLSSTLEKTQWMSPFSPALLLHLVLTSLLVLIFPARSSKPAGQTTILVLGSKMVASIVIHAITNYLFLSQWEGPPNYSCINHRKKKQVKLRWWHGKTIFLQFRSWARIHSLQYMSASFLTKYSVKVFVGIINVMLLLIWWKKYMERPSLFRELAYTVSHTEASKASN